MPEDNISTYSQVKPDPGSPVTGGKELPAVKDEYVQKLKKEEPGQLDTHQTTEAKAKGARLKSILTSRVVVLGVGNLIFIFLLAFFLINLPQKAIEHKKLRNESIRASSKGRTEIANFEIESVRERAERLAKLFPDESGLVDFVDQIEKIREEGAITRLSFASTEVVRDRTGYYGIPVLIEFRGSWSQIGVDLQKIQKLPFLFRAVSIKAEVLPEEENVVELDYGGFLYVDDKLGQD